MTQQETEVPQLEISAFYVTSEPGKRVLSWQIGEGATSVEVLHKEGNNTEDIGGGETDATSDDPEEAEEIVSRVENSAADADEVSEEVLPAADGTSDIFVLAAENQAADADGFEIFYLPEEGETAYTDVLVDNLAWFYRLTLKGDFYLADCSRTSEEIPADAMAYDHIAVSYQLEKKAKSDTVRILVIGNSFSKDTAEYLPAIARDAGYTNVKVGNYRLPGKDFSNIWRSKNEAGTMLYRYHDGTSWLNVPDITLFEILSQQWDVVYLQQHSVCQGKGSTFYNNAGQNFLKLLSDYICWQQEVHGYDQPVIGYEMTWAFPKNSDHSGYDYFRNNQKYMFGAICRTSRNTVETANAVDLICPVGTAIQNARSGYMGDTLNRDNQHLTTDIGRYIAGLTMAKSTGLDISGISKLSTVNDYSVLHLPYLKQYADDAVTTPYAVTQQSQGTPALDSAVLRVATYGKTRFLTWTSVRGATAFRVRRSTRSAKGFTNRKKLASTTLKYQENLSSNTLVYYRVYALGDHISNGAKGTCYIKDQSSSSVGGLYVSRVKKLTASAAGMGKLSLVWKRRSCTGYEIQYSRNSNFKGKRTVTVTNAAGEYILRGLSSKNIYYVRIRSFVKKGGVKYYSGWTTAKAARVR